MGTPGEAAALAAALTRYLDEGTRALRQQMVVNLLAFAVWGTSVE